MMFSQENKQTSINVNKNSIELLSVHRRKRYTTIPMEGIDHYTSTYH